MEREYPNSTKGLHEVLFVPESYLYGKLAEQVRVCQNLCTVEAA
jgi:hypothetical protein